MYPRVSDLFKDLLGIELPFPIYSFGLMLAIAILTAVWLAGRELDRMYRQGRIGSVRVPTEDGKGKRTASPSALIGTLSIFVVVGGIAGSKLFHILENPNDFAADPLGMIFSTGGLTFYGGLLVAGGAIVWYLRRHQVNTAAFADAAAPGLMIAYGIGRIGCYLAGDGDWGTCSYLENKPSWLPDWFWSETFPNSILDPGNQLTNDALRIENCPPAADGVYPTMLYEFLACGVVLFGILWLVRKHPFKNGWLFSLYLVFNGVERFLIEKIRVNNEFDVLGLTVTQAEVISTLIFLVGVAGLVYTTRRRDRSDETPRPEAEAAPAT
jgi:phosphatidylglycerol:prolipoprotein diacylglycerol transferase